MRVTTWWRALSGPAKFRLYTTLTLQLVIAVTAAVSAVAAAGAPWSTGLIVVSGLAALLAVHSQPELSGLPTAALRRWALPVGAAVLVSVWVAGAAVARFAESTAEVDAARSTGLFAALFAAISIVPFLRHKWWAVLGLSVGTGAALGGSIGGGLRLAGVSLVIDGALVATTLVTLWGLQVVEELERAKAVDARLQVAEERLRFSRDLHDVVGRGFSAIAVKSELAATLSRAGATDRAVAEMNDIRALAVDSLNQMRSLVKGYRDIDLNREVAGARSLLAAAGCHLTIEGDSAKVPRRFHEVAAWVVREGTTNIVKHSAATTATVSLGNVGMSLHNNGIVARPHALRDALQQTGLRGLTERLDQVGASLASTSSDEGFLLEIQWEKI